MSLADYAHWNEDAHYVWWEEEGRHDDVYDVEYDDYRDADDCFAEEVADMTTEVIVGHLSDADYRTRWPKAVPIFQFELDERSSL